MKRFLIGAAMLLVASPTLAMKVTNLDKIPHTIELVGRGTVQRYVIQPSETETITGATQGTISLVSSQNPKPSRSPVNADGMLSGIIGNGRTEGIQAEPDYNYTIWPGGQLAIQSRTRAIRGR